MVLERRWTPRALAFNSANLYDQIQSLNAELTRVSLTKGLVPIRRVNRAFNRLLHPDDVDAAMSQTSRRI